MADSDATFVMERTFDAPPARVWAALTEPARLNQWWGPPGMTTTVAKLELQPGGTFLYGMAMPGGPTMWGKWVFREIKAPEKLVYVVSFCDAEGNPVRHPMAPTWPLEMLCTATLAEQDGKTAMHSDAVPINENAVERQTFIMGFAGMRQGFSGTWNQLAAYLAKGE